MAIPVVDPEIDPYAVLGVSRGATADQIRKSYRARAKKAHPDAGGNPKDMERLTRAYTILSNASDRLRVDRRRDSAADAAARTQRTSTRAASAGDRPAPARGDHTFMGGEHPASYTEGTVTHDQRLGQARRYVWAQLEEFGWLAALAGGALSFLATQLPITRAFLLGAAGFLPVYWLVLQVIYMAVPELKLITYDTIRSPRRAHRRHLRALAITLTLWIPLAMAWSFALHLLPFAKPL